MKNIEKLYENGLLPIVNINEADEALKVAESIMDGGLGCLAIRFKNEQSFEIVARVKEKYPNLTIGLIDIFDKAQIHKAKDYNSDFIMLSSLDDNLLNSAIDEEIDAYPLCCNESDISKLKKYGLETLIINLEGKSDKKTYIDSLRYLFSDVKFIVIDENPKDNLSFYSKCKDVLAVSGTWVVPNDYVENKQYKEITEIIEENLLSMCDFRLAHVGINCENVEQSKKVANSFEKIFGFEQNENPGSIFNATYIEVLKMPFLGKKGHIAISTNSVDRAKAHLERKGISFNPDTLNYTSEGILQTVYTKDEIGEFAVHLVRRK